MRLIYKNLKGEVFTLDLKPGKNLFQHLPGLSITKTDDKLLAIFEGEKFDLLYKGKKIPAKKIFGWKVGQVLNPSFGGSVYLETLPGESGLSAETNTLQTSVPSNKIAQAVPVVTPHNKVTNSKVALNEIVNQLEQKLSPNLKQLSKLRTRFYILGIFYFFVLYGANTIVRSGSVNNEDPSPVISQKKTRSKSISNRRNKYNFTPANLTTTIVTFIFLPFFAFTRSKFRSEYKKTIVGEVFKELGTGWSYSHDNKIDENTIYSSKLFDNFNHYLGDDLVRGKIDGIPFEMCEIHLLKTSSTHHSKRRHKRQQNVFHGLFLVTHFHKNIGGETIVFPDSAQKLMGNLLGGAFQSLNSKMKPRLGDPVTLEDPRFEKEFSVYSSDQIAARYILDASTMEDFFSLKKRLCNVPFSASFIGNTLCLAIEYNRPLFEPAFTGPLISRKSLLEMMELFHVSQHVISELNNRQDKPLDTKSQLAV